jgi:hypothetical protein
VNETYVGRNDPCPCGSGKKFKKCCLKARSSYPVATAARFAQQPARSSFAGPTAAHARNGPPPRMSGLFDHLPPAAPSDEPDAPALDSIPLLPVEVGLHYTYPEPLGEAEVTFIFPGGKCFLLENDDPIVVERLKAGDRVVLRDNQIATITNVRLYYEPPDPPTVGENGRVLSRVIGTIKHKGPTVIDVQWAGYTATNSPEHPYYSVSRHRYVPANQLQLGELLRTDDNLVTPVLSVTQPRHGMIDLYNIEVEHFHNYYVGSGQGNAVLVHNGASGAGGYINTPKPSSLSPAQSRAIKKIDNIIKDHLKPGPKGDISGTVSDMVGNPIRKPGGGFFDHVKEMNDTVRGLRNQIRILERSTDPAAQAALQRARAALAAIDAATRGAGL